MPIVLYKIGGSLLTLPRLADRLLTIIKARADTRPLLTVGGGATANVVREWDRVHTLGDERAHRLAVQSLRLNERLIQDLLPHNVVVSDRSQAQQCWAAGRLPILCIAEFLQQMEPGSDIPLPHNWNVTSDSLAAWIAIHWPAQQLVLLKSADLPEGCTVRQAADSGLVDRYFPRLASQLPRIGWANLQEERPAIQFWQV